MVNNSLDNINKIQDFNSYAISSFTVEENFSKKGELIRYHYTSAEALLSILSERPELRFTDIHYMNDRSEMVYCVSCILKFLEKNRTDYSFFDKVVSALLLKRHSPDEYKNFSVSRVDFEDNKIYPYLPTRSFVFCMSKSGDSLPMWNYYVRNNKYLGYNIAFDVYKFLKSFDTDKIKTADPVIFKYGHVLYRENEQQKEVLKLAERIERDNQRKGETAIAHNMIFLRNYIESYGAFFKHPAFKNEEEYRIVLVITNNRLLTSRENYYNNNLRKLRLDYCERNGVLVPYMAVPINKDAFKKITISPTIEREISKQSLEDYLSQKNYNIEVKTSTIPIRF